MTTAVVDGKRKTQTPVGAKVPGMTTGLAGPTLVGGNSVGETHGTVIGET